jgi:anti-anti-sigma factor
VSEIPPEAPETLSIDVARPAEGVVLITLAGEVDIVSVDELRRRVGELEPLLPAHVVFDLSAVAFIDSSGINALVQGIRGIERGGGTGALTAPSREARRVFEIIGLSQVVTVVQDRDAAMRPPPDEPPSVADLAT